MTGDDCGNEGVKDPVVYMCGGIYHLFANYAPGPAGGDPEKIDLMHAQGNAFVLGVVNKGTGLATSLDGMHFRWEGSVLESGTGSLRYLSSVPVKNKLYYYLMSTQGRTDRTSCDWVWYLDEGLT